MAGRFTPFISGMAVQQTTTSLYILDKIPTAKSPLSDVSFAAS